MDALKKDEPMKTETRALKTAERGNLHLKVAAEIGAEIVAGRLPVGSLIPAEPELCARFGVSRTVVREAVKHLCSKGLLRTGSGTGTTAASATAACSISTDSSSNGEIR